MLFAQQGFKDSLIRVLKMQAQDTARVNALNQLGKFIRAKNPDSALLLSNQALSLARKLNFNRGEIRALSYLGSTYHFLGNYPLSFKYLFDALKMGEESGDKVTVAQINNNLGNTYNYLGDYDKARVCFERSIEVKKSMRDIKGIITSANGLGVAYGNMRKYEDARREFTGALKMAKELDAEQYLALCYNNMGYFGAKEGNYVQAITDQKAALEVYLKTNSSYDMGISYCNIAYCHLMLGNYSEAEKNALQALKHSSLVSDLEGIREANEYLSTVYEQTGRPKLALETYKDYIRAKDSLANEENTKETVRHEMNYEFEKKESTARLEQEKKDAIAIAETKRQRIILMAISGFGLLVLGFALFAYRSFLQKKKANIEISRQKHLIEEKQKEILDSIHYAKRIQTALIPSEWYIQKQLKRMTGNA